MFHLFHLTWTTAAVVTFGSETFALSILNSYLDLKTKCKKDDLNLVSVRLFPASSRGYSC